MFGPQLAALFWKVAEPLGGGGSVSLKPGFEVSSLVLLSVHSPLPTASLSCCPTFPWHRLYLQTMSWKKPCLSFHFVRRMVTIVRKVTSTQLYKFLVIRVIRREKGSPREVPGFNRSTSCSIQRSMFWESSQRSLSCGCPCTVNSWLNIQYLDYKVFFFQK